MRTPLGKFAVLRARAFLELDEALVGQNEDVLDYFAAHLPAQEPAAAAPDELPHE